MSYADYDMDMEYARQDAAAERDMERRLNNWAMYGPEWHEDWMTLGICDECGDEVELDNDGLGHCDECDCEVYRQVW